jgi:hypothetical protein
MHRTIHNRVRSDEMTRPFSSPVLICIAIVLLAASAGPASADSVPQVTGISPSGGPMAGGTNVTITGSGFSGATNVQFGVISGTGLNIVNDSRLTIVSPPHSAGTVAISVTGASGARSAENPYSMFQYEEVSFPRVSAVSPSSGPITGDTVVTITGSGFTGAESVRFGEVYAWDIDVIDDSHLTARTPQGSPGLVSIVVKNAVGTGVHSERPAMFMYEFPFPELATISPISGSTGGGTLVTVTGSGLSGATNVRFGGISGTGLMVIDDSHLTIVSPPNPAGAVGLSVINPEHTGYSAGSAAVFRYDIPVPRLTNISPGSGSTEGGTVVTLTGSGFSGTKDVKFGEKNATGLTVIDDRHITIIAPVHPPGSVPISITNGIGEGGSLGPSTMFHYVYSQTPTVITTSAEGTSGRVNSSPAGVVPAASPARTAAPGAAETAHTPGFEAVAGLSALGAIILLRKTRS